MVLNNQWSALPCPCACRYAEPAYGVENQVIDGEFEGSMDGLKKVKHHKKDQPQQARAQVAAAQRAAQQSSKVQVS